MAEQAPPEDVNNANTGSTAGGDDASAVATPTFPDRLRVHALAKIIGVTSKQVLAKLGELGIEARSAQSSLGRDAAETVHASFNAPADSSASQVPVTAPVVEAPPVEPAAAEPNLSVQNAEPAAVAPAARPAFSTPLFLQPEAPAEAPPKRRRSRKAAGPAADNTATDTATFDTATTDIATDRDRGRDGQSDSVTAAGTRAAESVEDKKSSRPEDAIAEYATAEVATSDHENSDDSDDNIDGDDDQGQPRRRRRGRRGRGRGRGDQSNDGGDQSNDSGSDNSGSNDSVSGDNENENTDSDNGDDEAVNSESSGDSAETSESDGDETSARRPRRRSRSRSNANTNTNADADSNAFDSDEEQGSADASATDGVDESTAESAGEDSDDDQDGGDGSSRRRRRRRRRRSTGDASPENGSSDETSSGDDPPNTVVHEREPRNKSRTKDEVQGITGSTRLEAKRQRRRDGRDAGRRRPPILTESEFLARRESVDRVMVVREKSFGDGRETTQVAVLEDGVLVEHFVTSSESASMVGNVYLGRVQNVLPSMEAAFIDIGRGRNGVLYAGEVNWDAAGLGGNSRKIEQALKPGDQVLVQVSKDPVGHKGARLTTQLSLAGRFLVYVPGGSSTGISRKLPDTERKRLKEILRGIVPSEAGVIIRTAAEGVSEEELALDVSRLQAQWATIEEASAKAESGKGSQPQTLYEEPDLLVKVIRDLFNEDFVKLVIEGEKAWATTSSYIETVAAEMLPKLERHTSEPGRPDVFEAHRINEQLSKALDRKVWLPSGGTLVIDRTEAMTVVDVNTGKFTGAGGNLEETVTRNNLEAAEEVVRQMRLRDIGGMIVVDFIDMVLESNRDLVLRRLTEALGRDRTRHQVSEVTSLGLVQMTRKKLGTGLIEVFSTNCEHCQGRGIVVHSFPVENKQDDGSRSNSSRGDSGPQRKRRGREKSDTSSSNAPESEDHDTAGDSSVKRAHPAALAMAAHHDDVVADVTPAEIFDGRGGSSPDAIVIGAADVAAVQGNTASVETSAAEDSPNTDVSVSAPLGAATEVPSADSGASSNGAPRTRGRRKASRPAASSAAGTAQASVEPSAPEASVSPTVESATGASSPDAVVPEPAQPQSEVPAPEAGAGEPVVKARRGRRVARKAAAPTSEASDAGTTIVIPTDHDAPSHTAEPVQAPITSPAAAIAGVEDSPDRPASKPRRRRASVRPAGPPADA